MSFAEATELYLAETSARNPTQPPNTTKQPPETSARNPIQSPSTSYVGEIQPGWDIVGNANGGYLMSLFARAALLDSARPDIISVSAHFLAPGKPGSVEALVTPIKDGKRFNTSRVELGTSTRTYLSGTVITGDLDQGEGPELITTSAPQIAKPDDCIRVVASGSFPPPFSDRIDQRLDPTTTMDAKPGPVVRGWMRLLDDEPIDVLTLVLASDSQPPTVFNTDLEPNWVPTVQMTVHIRQRPKTKWLLLNSETRFVSGGMFEVDNTVFDEEGHILAHSRQLQLLGLAHTP